MLSFIALAAIALSPPSNQLEQLIATPRQTEEWLEEKLDAHIIWIEHKPWTVYGCIEKDGYDQFFKIQEAGKAQLELEQGKNLRRYLPTIVGEEVISIPPFDCLVEPYLKSIEQPGGMFFDSFYLFPEQVIPLLSKIIDQMKQMVFKTLDVKIAPALNDRYYHDRLRSTDVDGVPGRLETYYSGEKILGIPWEELLDRKFQIDGLDYHMTLKELVRNAKDVLNPHHLRPLAICHGDWTDMNICIVDGDPYFLDCEIAGENDPIGDAVVFLVYNAVQGDYLGPKYFANHFPHRQKALGLINLKRDPVYWDTSGNVLSIQGGHHFGTSANRREAIRLFIDTYFNPLLDEIRERGFTDCEIEERVRAALLARLLVVYNLTKLDPQDQARTLSLMMKTLCQKNEPALSVFWRNL